MDPLIASNDGYMLTQDGRIALRFGVGSQPVALWRSETKDLGLGIGGITPEEAYALASRVRDMPALEDAVLTLQRDAARLRTALQRLYNETHKGQPPSAKALVEASQILRDTE